MAALTGQERGLPPGSYLNDTVDEGPGVAQVSVVWQPYEDTVGGLSTCRFTFTPANVHVPTQNDGAKMHMHVLLLSC